MTGHVDTERILDAFLAPEHDRLADRVLEASFADIARTPQRRALRVPWRFPYMPALTRATGIAAVALVAVVGAGGLIYLNSRAPGNAGATQTPTLTPAPTPNTPGITGWKTYTSAVYGYTISYPEDWSRAATATRKWQPGDASVEDSPVADIFVNPEAVDGDSIAFLVLQIPAPAGADLRSWDGFLAALTEMCANPAEFYSNVCPSDNEVTHLCLGSPGCQPVALLHDKGDQPRALFGDPETGMVTYIHVGRNDDFPAAARYGGTLMLLKSILGQLGVRAP